MNFKTYRFLLTTSLLLTIIYKQLEGRRATKLLQNVDVQQEQTLTIDELQTQSHAQTTNLVIINDVQEYNRYYLSYMINFANVGAMHIEFIKAMSENQSVLCPKSLWCSVQNIVDTVEKFATTQAFTNIEDKIYQQKFTELKNLYLQLKSSSDNKETDSFYKILNSDTTIDPKIKGTIGQMFSVYIRYQDIITKPYTCKEVNSDFILFLPNDLSNKSKSSAMKDFLVGLSYSKLPNYIYKTPLNPTDNDKIIENGQQTNSKKSLGKILLNTLKSLKIKDCPKEYFPWINIYITGHGSQDFTAEMSTLPNKEEDGITTQSDFLNVMNCFNNDFKTKSVAISSCFPGGKKILESYNITNKLDNISLEQINYPIINIGSTFESTFTKILPVSLEKINFFESYFKLLNEIPPNYQKALSIMAQNGKENYGSIRFQNTSWFSPIQYKKEVKELSQIAMSTRKKSILINNEIKIIILNANYIPKSLIFNAECDALLPWLLPANYHNQNYYFESLRMPNIKDSFHNVLIRLLQSSIKEPINIIFKHIQIGSKELFNVLCFIHESDSNPNEPRTGYIYTNKKGETKTASWPSNNDWPYVIEEQNFNRILANNKIQNIEKKIKEYILPSLTPESLSKLQKIFHPAAQIAAKEQQQKMLSLLNNTRNKLNDKKTNISAESTNASLEQDLIAAENLLTFVNI
ncbi:MAG: hypothetical protein NTU89_03150 [Candidatus Dependentiae bacterium]|nr:hypothetical protein [Candidatus Dependentiae bacterium]